MRKHLLLLVSMAAMLLTSMFSVAQTVYFTDGFEEGLKEGWTQEYFDMTQGKWVTETPDISQPWKTESAKDGALQYPNGAAKGQGRAYFRQEAAAGKHVQTTGYRTRLITPMMDLSSGYQPILRFYHAQAKWTADFDTLRVYYRQGVGTQWHLLEECEYTSPIQKWKFEEIDLPLVGADYQIAFEASENMGRGIVLDSVIIRTKPQITTPHDMGYTDMRDNGVTLTWEASKDADFFRVVVTDSDFDLNIYPDSLDKLKADSVQRVFADTIIDGEIMELRVENLQGGHTYYMQVQSLSEDENSVWSQVYSFRMKPVVNITADKGYFEDFNIPYKSNLVKDMQLETWTWSGVDPIIPTWIGVENYYMYSPDASCAVVYTGQNKSSSGELTYSIPAGDVQYIVSPEISGKDIPNFKMSMCHVTFWGTTYKYQHNLAKSIIVGVVTDPEDYTTFVPVDTCEVWGYMHFTWFDVDLASYTGDGRYIAFVSNFQDKENWFALDKVTIEVKPTLGAVTASDIKVVPTTTEAQLSWPAVTGATSYKVKYLAMETKGKQVPLTEDKMVGATTVSATTNAITLTGLTARTKFVYSVQAVGAADALGAWSQPREFYTSAEMEIPATYGFEEDEGRYTREGVGEAANEYYPRDWCAFTNDADAPYLYTSYYRSGTRCLYLVKDQYNDAWTVSPMIEDVKQIEVVFYARQSSTSYKGSNVIVGVMEDPSDLNTFTPIATCTPADIVYERFYVNFVNYQGTGKYIALVWGDEGTSKNALCIDDLTIRPLASCFAPTIEALVTDSSAILRWTKKDETNRYTIKVSATALTEDKIPTATGKDLLLELNDYDADSLILDSLDFSTQYFVYAKAVCSATDESDWSGMSFKTDCPQKMKLPYKTSFEKEPTSTIPYCWTKPTWTTTTSTYPYVTSSTSAHTGSQYLYMYSYTTYGSTIALPQLDADLENVKLRFWAYYSSAGYKVFAGVMGNPNDPEDFYPVDTFETVASQWVLCEAMFSAEDLKHGSYLALSSFTGASNYVYVDDIEVINVVNEPPFNYKKVDAGTDWFEVAWDGKTTGQWDIIVSKSCYAMPDSLADKINPADFIPAADIIANTQTAKNGYKVESGLTSLTWYYLYGKSTASSKWSMDSIQTECTTWNPRVKQIQGFETDAAGNDIRTVTYSLSTTKTAISYYEKAIIPECWTVGNGKWGTDLSKATSSTYRNYFPYICTDGTGSSASTTAYADKAGTSYQYSSDGVNSLKVYGSYSSTASSNYAPAWAAMNKLECSDEDLKSLILTFDYAMATTASYAVIVGIMDDPTDLSTFTVLDSIGPGIGTGSHKHLSAEVALDQYEGTGRYIAFRTPMNKTTTFYLDNVSVNLATCPNPNPSISQRTDTTAVLASGLRVDNAWQYIITDTMYQPSLLDEGKMPTAEHIVAQAQVLPKDEGDAAPKMTRILGLDPNTNYYVYASTLCEENEISSWKLTSFKTLCADVSPDTWVGNFENDTTVSGYKPECWTVGSLTPGAADTYIPYVLSTTRKEIMDDPAAAKVYNKDSVVTGAKVLRMYAYSTTSIGSYAITPGLQMPAGKTIRDYQVMFKGYGTSAQSGYTTSATYAHNLRVGVATDPSDISTIKILDTVSLPTNTQQCAVELSKYEGDGKYIVFLLEKEAPTYSYAFIYDIYLAPIPACKVPGSIKLDTIGDTFVKASWIGNSSQYKVAVSKELYTDEQKKTYFTNDSVIAADKILFKTATESSITFDGLEANEVYYLYVQGKCSDTEMSLWSYESPMFHTECPAEMPVPYKENFNKYASSTKAIVDCWSFADFTTSSSNYPYTYKPTSGAQDGTMLELWSTGTTHRNAAMMPKVAGNLKDYILSFDTRPYGGTATGKARLIVGTMDDINDSTTFVPFDTIKITDGTKFTHREYVLADYNLAYGQIAFSSGLGQGATLDTASDVLVDNVRLGLPISCFQPQNIAISNIGLSVADLTFTPADETSTKWEIELTKVGGAKQNFTTDKPSYHFTTLEPQSSYSVIIRTVCDGDYSDYTDPITFNTKWTIDTYKWSFTSNEQGTKSIPSKPGAALATYTLHPALTPTGSDTLLHYASNTTYIPYQIANTASLAYAEDKRNFVAGSDTARALRLYRTNTYDSAAVILPYIVNPQGKQLSMDLRFGYAYTSSHTTDTLQDLVSTVYPSGILCIGTVDSMQNNLHSFQEITRVYAHPMFVKDTLLNASNYGWMHYVMPIDMDLTGKQLVLMIKGSGTQYIYIDNLAVEAAQGISTPVITFVGKADTYATLNWTGNASSYNIYVVDTANVEPTRFMKKKFIPYLQDAPAACVDTIKNVTGNSYKVTGLTPGGNTYAFYVEDAANAALAGALSNRQFATTVCQAVEIEGSYSYDFEPGPSYKMGANPSKSTADGFTFQWPTSTTAGDTVYKTPECWNYGITYSSYDKTSTTYKSYNPTLRSNSMTAAAASQYRYARSGYSCMQFYGTSTYKEVYAVMPLLTGYDPDTMEINFWGRCTYEKVQGGTIYTTSYLKGTSYSTKLAVGTMTDPEDPSTFVALDTVEYDYTANDMSTSTVASSDPTGNSYWLNFTVPMKGAVGPYIAFRQVGYGYFYMDDLKIQKRQTARRPNNPEVVEVGSTTATIAWNGMEEGGTYEVQLSTSATNWTSPKSFVAEKDTFTFENLEVAKEYFFRVKQVGSIYGNSDYTHYVTFRTECLALNPNGYKTSFECDDDTDPWMVIPGATGTNVNTMKQNQCWTYWNMGTTQTVSSTYFPYNIANTSAAGYSHSGGYALKINQYTTAAGATTYRMCVVSPLIDAEIGEPGKGFDTLQVSFWACPTYHGLSGTNKDKISSASGTTYAKYIEIGTCTDPADSTTYTVLQGWTYEVEGDNLKTGVQADANNDYAFRKVTVKLNNATGPYVFIRPNVNRGDGKAFTYSTMYIDDFKFETLLNCPVPANLQAEDVTVRNAKIMWEGEALTYDLQVSEDATFTDEAKALVDTIALDTTSFFVEGLQPNKQYYYRVKAYCDADRKDASDWTAAANFRTPYAPMYLEDFTMSLGEWKMAYGYADKVFSGEIALRDTTTSGTYNSWYRVQNLALSGYAVRMLLGYAASANPTYPISSTYQAESYYQKYWLVGPSITIEKENAQLAFEAALTNYTTADPITAHSHWDEGWDDQFMVIISEDDGKTWKRENAVVWNNETTNDKSDEHYKYGIGDYVLTDISATPTQLSVDLNKYTGKTIRIAFYGENTDQNAMNAIHVDKIHVNYLTKLEESIELCQFEDIDDVLGFSINGDSVPAGEAQLKRSVLSYENGTNDSLFVLNVNYKEAPQYYYEITVCEGTPFEYMGFNQHTAPGTYRMKLTSQVTGCDSIVNFTIKHTEAYQTTIDTTICYGTYITFDGKQISEAGQYVANYQACEKLGGCDSIVTLNLKVTSPIITSLTPSICAGGEYVWEGADTTLTTRGTYTHIFPAANGCDSVVNVTLTVIDPVRTPVKDSLPEGGAYIFGDQIITQAGVYEKHDESVMTGCDSITILTFSFIPAPVKYEAAAICAGESYEFAGKLLKEPGIYRDTTYAEDTHYMSITELALVVNQPISFNLGNKYINAGDSYDFYGKQLTETGIYYDTVSSVITGCDSINYMNLVVLTDTTGFETKSVCASELPIVWKGITIEKEGTYQFDTLTIYQTDSVVYLTLEVIQPVRATLNESFCEGGFYEMNGKAYTLPGTYYDTLTSAVTGCDSIITLVLTRIAAPVIPLKAAICDGEKYEFGDKQLTEPGIYRDTVYAAETHCMEIQELTLTVNHPVSINIIENICAGESYEFFGKILTETGVYSDTLQSVLTGCDSIINLTLNVAVLTNKNISEAICEGDVFIFGGKELTEEGLYYDTLHNSFGCDSIITTLRLVVNKPTTYEYNYALCAGGTYDFFGNELTVAGDYTDTIANILGCDSIVTVHLTINEPLTGTQRAEFCGETYTYQGQQYGPGTHEVWLKNEHGCDSIVTLILTQTTDVHDTLHVTLCSGETYSDENFTVNKPGTYYNESAAAGGCTIYRVLYFAYYDSVAYVVDSIYTTDLPYVNEELGLFYDEKTEAGIYQDTIYTTGTEGCDLTVYHTLNVIESQGILDIYEEGGQKVLKVLYRDHIYIIRNDGWYTISGQRIDCPVK